MAGGGGGGGVGGTVHTIFLLPFLFGNAFCGFFRNEAEHSLPPLLPSYVGGERRGDLPVPSQSRARARVGPLRFYFVRFKTPLQSSDDQ